MASYILVSSAMAINTDKVVSPALIIVTLAYITLLAGLLQIKSKNGFLALFCCWFLAP
jgi:hypothetical protein